MYGRNARESVDARRMEASHIFCAAAARSRRTSCFGSSLAIGTGLPLIGKKRSVFPFTQFLIKSHLSVCRGAVRPNPSLKLSPNGKPPGPRSRYGVHFLQRGPGVLPLSPA